MRLPSLDDLIAEQKIVHEAPCDISMFILGPPGSGKTSLAVFKLKQLAEQKKSCLLITKNRLLASLASQLGSTRVMTMHAYFSSEYWKRFRVNAPEPVRFQYDWHTIMDSYAQRDVKPVLDHMVIDEGQNLPPGFFAWAVRFGAHSVTVFADEDQTTDGQRSSIKDILKAPLPDPIRLTVNHRNTREIAALAEHFHKSNTLPAAVVRRPRSGEIPKIESFTKWDDVIPTIVNRLKNRGGSVGVIAYPITQVERIHSLLKATLPGVRVDLYTSATKKGDELKIHPLEDGITVLTGESAIGLEFDTVYLQDLSRSLPAVSDDQFRLLYMLCARARDSLTLLDGHRPLTTQQLSSFPDSTLLKR